MKSITSDEENSLYTKLPLPSQQYGSTQSDSQHDKHSTNPFCKLMRRRSFAEYDNFKKEENFVISSLNPHASEVAESVSSTSIFDRYFFASSTISFGSLRSKYKLKRKQYRVDASEMCSFMDSLYHRINCDAYISHLRRVLFTNWVIVLFVRLDLMVDLVFCLLYLLELKQYQLQDLHLTPLWLFKWRSWNVWAVCCLLSLWNFMSFILRVSMAKQASTSLFSFRGFVEWVTTVPLLASIFITNGRYLYVPYFLRSWVFILRIKSAMKIKVNLQMTDKAVDPIRIKLINLLTILTALVYNGVALFSYSESTFAHRHYTLLELLYMVSVTLSTVGYGDITPVTDAGRIIIILLIGSSLSIIPALIADLLDTIRKKNYGGGCIKDESIPFILIIGSFTPEQVNDILDGFLSREISETHLSVVFLVVNDSLTEDLKMMERNSIWGHRIQFLHGSTLNNDALQRSRARYAQAIFTMSDDRAIDPLMEDEQNTARLWTLYCYTARHSVPIYSYNLDTNTATYQNMAKEIICVGEFKQSLLAMNCRCPGASTLLTNLLHQRRPIDNYEEPWQAQYDDGLCCEIYTSPAAECIVGNLFGYASWVLYRECQVILFAIKTNDKEGNNNGILLNPGNSYTIKKSDLCIYIAENPKEVRDIDGLCSDYIRREIMELQRTRAYFPTQTSNVKESSVGSVFFSSTNTTPTPSSPSSSLLSMSPSISPLKNSMQTYQLSKLPSSRHEFLNSGRFLAAKLGGDPSNVATKLPLCYLLETPIKLIDAVFSSVDHLAGHILVCLHHEVKNVFKLIYNLRTHYVAPEDIQDIVLLCSSLPDQKTFQSINMFPRVYFVEGDCKQPEDLLRAGVTRAKKIVIMRLEERATNHMAWYRQGRSWDSPAIMANHIIDLLLQDSHGTQPTSTIVNLVEKSNINYMHLLQGIDLVEETDVFYSPSYASGGVVADSLISNVLLSQTYYKPDIVSILKVLIGMNIYGHPDHSTTRLNNQHDATSHQYSPTFVASKNENGSIDIRQNDSCIWNSDLSLPPTPTRESFTSASSSIPASSPLSPIPTHFRTESHLNSIPLPAGFTNQSFMTLFDTLLLDHGVLTIGLLRAPTYRLGNKLPFVYTNPVPSLILEPTDSLYVLSPIGWSLSTSPPI